MLQEGDLARGLAKRHCRSIIAVALFLPSFLRVDFGARTARARARRTVKAAVMPPRRPGRAQGGRGAGRHHRCRGAALMRGWPTFYIMATAMRRYLAESRK